MSSIGRFTSTYDSNGDVLNDALHSYAWDVETRPTTIDTVTVTYDALERMVEQSKSGTNTEIVYDALGNKLALMNGTSTLVKAFAPLPAGATAVYNASGLQYYRHPDWLGSSRFSSTPTRTMYNDLAYAPFGEQYAQAGSTGVTDTSFAGNSEDTTTNLYDARFREYGIQGRWPSPDPAGLAAANPANPQSWNRYAYVMNSPLNFVDPSGLYQGGIPYDPAPVPFDSFTYIGIPVFGVSPDLNSWLGIKPISNNFDLQGALGIPLVGNGLSLGPFGQPQNPQNPTPPNPTPPNPNNQQLKPNPQPQAPPSTYQRFKSNVCTLGGLAGAYGSIAAGGSAGSSMGGSAAGGALLTQSGAVATTEVVGSSTLLETTAAVEALSGPVGWAILGGTVAVGLWCTF